ncbi:O-antigen ligase family protein [Candidatus Saccharibacteria bacterium]|nr:O-antigen ligase family protein [Candidatus Saccharibacteria bacterium]
MKILNRAVRVLIYILPAVLFFSYYPVIALGSSETMNFELSLPILWLVVFDGCFAVWIIMKKRFGEVLRNVRRGGLWLVFPVFVTLTTVWSENVVRGVMTCGILWLLVFAIYGIFKMKEDLYDERVFYYVFLKMFFASSLVICGWCVAQCVMDTLGVPRDYTLMCRGCVTQMFGFPHPNGFAIEPQFMGNLLLAPAIVAVWLIITGKHNSKNSERKSLLLCFFVIAATLFLTFSRGAIYAFVVGMMFMSGFLLMQEKGKIVKRLGVVWGMTILSFLFALNLQGILAQVGPTNDTYGTGVAKVLNHLSLGIIDVRSDEDEVVENPVENFEEGNVTDAVFDGYVEESTGIRMELTKNAIAVWTQDARTVLFGVGIGGAGQAMYDMGLTGSPKEIIQNEYASLLAETGLVGVICFVWLVVMMIREFMKSQMSGMLFSLLVVYAVSLLFFSGLANALQIYLMPAVLYIVLRKKLVS